MIINPEMQLSFGSDPWPHVVIDKFLSAKSLKVILNELSKSEKYFQTVGDHPAKIRFALVKNLPAYKIFCSKDFFSLIYRITQTDFKLNEKSGIQFRFSDPDSPAFPRHNDFIEKRTLVFLFYLSDWNEQMGGNLELYKQRGKLTSKVIVPIKNRLVFFYSDKKNVHAVQKIKRGNRYSIVFEMIPYNKGGQIDNSKTHALLF